MGHEGKRSARPVVPIPATESPQADAGPGGIPDVHLHADRLRALGQRVSTIAHELNNPLTSILGYAQLLCGRLGSSGVGREAHYILEQAEHASRIVKSLLLYAREGKPERTLVDLNELAKRTVALRSSDLRVRNIQIEAELNIHAHPVLGDPTQLQQVLLNLVLNAEQSIHQRGGGGRIRLRTSRPSSERVAIEVTDNGVGIAANVLPRIFDPFFTTKPPGIGTGLGLSIVYGIIRDHDGEVLVESREGRGAIFKVILPVAPRTATASESLPSAHSVQAAGKTPGDTIKPMATTDSGHGARILVVEDEPTVARLISDVLGADGHHVDVTLDSREGLARAAAAAYDLIICDLRMPNLDGRNFFQELSKRDTSISKRLVFVTGDILSPQTVAFLEASGVPCVAKPFLAEELKSSAYGVLRGAERLSPAANRDNAMDEPGAISRER